MKLRITWCFLLCVSLGFLTGCDRPADKACSRQLKVLKLPVDYELSKRRSVLGTLRVDTDETLHFEASTTADPEEAAAVQAIVAKMGEKAALGYSYNERTSDVHYSCGGAVERGTPEYADGVRWYLYSSHFIDVKRLE